MNYIDGDPRDQLSHVGRGVVRAGLVVGSGGNLSVRVPGTDECWVTAAGTWLDRLDRSCFVRVRVSDGSVVRGSSNDPGPGNDTAAGNDAGSGTGAGPGAAVPTTELALHLATYRRRPDAAAVVHLHPQSVLLLDAVGERIRLVTTDHVYYLRRVATTPFRLPGGSEVADVAAAAVADGTNCVILAHHGCSVLGETVELAHKRVLYLEEAARLTYQALLLGRPVADCPAEFLARLTSGAQTTV